MFFQPVVHTNRHLSTYILLVTKPIIALRVNLSYINLNGTKDITLGNLNDTDLFCRRHMQFLFCRNGLLATCML